MTLTLNKPYFVKRVADNGGTLHFLPVEGFCTGVTLNKPYPAKRVADKEGVLHFLLSNQQLANDGKLVIGKPYFAKRVADKEGVLHFLINGKQCANTLLDLCGCEICCTLDATLEVQSAGDIHEWTAPVDVTLTCGETFETHSGYCCRNDEVEDDTFCFKVTSTWAEKNTIGSPEAWTDGISSGTRECDTHIWSSGDIIIDGNTYRVTFWYSTYTITTTSPVPSTYSACVGSYFIQKLVNDEVYGDVWNLMGAYPTYLQTWLFTITDDNPYSPDDCPEGFSYSGGELAAGYFCNYPAPTYVGGGYGISSLGEYGSTNCSVFEASEAWYRLATDPDTCENRIKCYRITIIDRCSGLMPCAALSDTGGLDITLDYSVGACHAGSGSDIPYTGAACSDFCLFNGGTANIFEGADTTFDENDLGGPEIVFQWCDSEATYWTTGDYVGLVEFAFCCMQREDGAPYLCFYALLSLSCPGPGSTLFAFKTRDISITFEGGYRIVSITGLTPFASLSGTPGCECDLPELSIALKFKESECP